MANLRHPCIVSFYGVVTTPAACVVTGKLGKPELPALLRLSSTPTAAHELLISSPPHLG